MILCARCQTSGPISGRVFVTQRRLSGFVWVLKSPYSGRFNPSAELLGFLPLYILWQRTSGKLKGKRITKNLM
ncbi:hypothetical protein PHYPO_G00087310 [Pangasianodon hypophthalmus]|uniref:Uncharacterized protein n=1 Tax=Pangasianodon hypophthalmus TaxID=310915 RepID=A0A5N5LHR4_PANHP|nr:hypothetical protein PHYPO_G00087310 [Pangasianodon hypophthalmus]